MHKERPEDGDRPSVSNPRGDTYQAKLLFPPPPGFPPSPVALERGWASVDVKLRDKSFRFVTTHLEGSAPPEAAAIQVAQGRELLAGPAATDLPVVLVGDFNSRADGRGTPTYGNLTSAGFDDAWLHAGPSEVGLTCCFAAVAPESRGHARQALIAARSRP